MFRQSKTETYEPRQTYEQTRVVGECRVIWHYRQAVSFLLFLLRLSSVQVFFCRSRSKDILIYESCSAQKPQQLFFRNHRIHSVT